MYIQEKIWQSPDYTLQFVFDDAQKFHFLAYETADKDKFTGLTFEKGEWLWDGNLHVHAVCGLVEWRGCWVESIVFTEGNDFDLVMLNEIMKICKKAVFFGRDMIKEVNKSAVIE